ncbi:TPA: hypothetical protein ACH3X1_011731 [Trebouxia sp. C0004]
MNSGAMEHATDDLSHQPKPDPVSSKAGKSMRPPASTAAMPPPAGKAVGIMPPARKKNVADADPQGDVRQAAMKAAAEAASAASHLTPAQRERAINEAASQAIAQQQAARADGNAAQDAAMPAGPPRAAGIYAPPDWDAAPDGLAFTLETMKNGTVVELREVNTKGHYTFGRSDTNDFKLEHPSISRLHAVLQFSATGESFLYDAGSAHGSFLNKQRLKPQVHVPVRVGDMIRFGLSTRLYLFGGPEDLRPAEGLSKLQKKQLAGLEAKEKRQAKEAQLAKAQMDAARRGGVSWGMAEEAALEEEDLDSVTEVDWRLYSQTHTLTDKQQKLADKIRRQEQKIHNLQTETDRIKAKQSDAQELTSGQASTMARNEQVIDTLTEEVDDLDEVLNESILDSIVGKRKAKEAIDKKTRKRRRGDEDDDDEDIGDADDNFYDRTEGAQRQKHVVPEALDAATLLGQKEALQTEKARLQLLLAKEEQSASAAETQHTTHMDSAQHEEEKEDELDAFMGQVAVQLEHDKVGALKQEISELAAKIQEADRLLKVADPDGYFKSGSCAAEAAKARAQKAMQLEKQQKEAQERRRKEKLATQRLELEAFVPEEEADDEVVPPKPTVSFAPSQAPAKASATASASAASGAPAAATAAAATSNGAAADPGRGKPMEAQGLQVRRRHREATNVKHC